MRRDPSELKRYTASERANHWVVGICFILLGLSGLALFHPMFYPLALLFGGGTWVRILHPFLGLVMAAFFTLMALRFWRLNVLTPIDWQWLSRVRELVDGDEHNMPEVGKYNGGQKLLFWMLIGCVALLLASGLLIWRAYFAGYFPVDVVRLGAVLHAAAAAAMIGLILVHVYAAIWVRGTIGAMVYGTVPRAWARQHHRLWYRSMTK
jgi:formate dehydrogenase subunit gamma